MPTSTTVLVFAFGGQDKMTPGDPLERGPRPEIVGREGLVKNTGKSSLESMVDLLPQVKLHAQHMKLLPKVLRTRGSIGSPTCERGQRGTCR